MVTNSIDLLSPTHLVGQSLSSKIWGGVSTPISQDFGVAGFRPDWYEYSGGLGWPAGYHVGLDIGVPKGTAIKSPSYAKVDAAGWSDSFRPNPVTLITIDDPATPAVDESGEKIILGHLWSNAVHTGDVVRPGDLLGFSGEQTVLGTMQPDGSGPHLHLETRMASDKGTTGEVAVNPLPWVEGVGVAGDALQTGHRLVSGVSGGTGSTAGGDSLAGISALAGRAGVYVLGLGLLIFGLVAIAKATPAGRLVRAAT